MKIKCVKNKSALMAFVFFIGISFINASGESIHEAF